MIEKQEARAGKSIKQLQKIVFRVDADEHMGTGHVYRCLALAFGFQHFKCDILFLVNASACKALRVRSDVKFSVVAIPRSMSEEKLLDWTVNRIGDFRPDLIVLDGYHFSNAYCKELAQLAVDIMAIDDQAKADLAYAGLILNTAPYAENLDYSRITGNNTKLLLGSRYCLLRPEFSCLEKSAIAARNHLLITFGGADPLDLSAAVLPFLAQKSREQSKLSQIKIDLVTGPAYKGKRLDHAIDASGLQIHHYDSVPNMALLYQRARLAIASAGSTIYELAAAGVPSLLTVVAKNQLLLATESEQSGWAISFDFMAERKREKQLFALVQAADNVLSDDARLKRMHLACEAMNYSSGTLNAARTVKNWFNHRYSL